MADVCSVNRRTQAWRPVGAVFASSRSSTSDSTWGLPARTVWRWWRWSARAGSASSASAWSSSMATTSRSNQTSSADRAAERSLTSCISAPRAASEVSTAKSRLA